MSQSQRPRRYDSHSPSPSEPDYMVTSDDESEVTEEEDEEGGAESVRGVDEIDSDRTARKVLMPEVDAYDRFSFKFVSSFDFELTPQGCEKLQKTSEGPALYGEMRLLPETTQGTLCSDQYHPELIGHLLKHSDSDHIFPIVAKDDEVLLKVSFVGKFSNSRRMHVFSSRQLYLSGVCKAIFNHFDQNKEALNVTRVTVLEPQNEEEEDDEDTNIKILLRLAPTWCDTDLGLKPPLCLLETINVTMTADNIGYKHLAPKLRDQERYRAYRILMSSSTLPSEVMALLEKRLTDFINRRLIKAYGALFNAAYTSRKSKVIAHVSEIADMIAKIQMRDDKFRKMKAERELKSSGWLESDVELDESNVMLLKSGYYKPSIVLSATEVETQKDLAEQIKDTVLDRDKDKFPPKDFKPILTSGKDVLLQSSLDPAKKQSKPSSSQPSTSSRTFSYRYSSSLGNSSQESQSESVLFDMNASQGCTFGSLAPLEDEEEDHCTNRDEGRTLALQSRNHASNTLLDPSQSIGASSQSSIESDKDHQNTLSQELLPRCAGDDVEGPDSTYYASELDSLFASNNEEEGDLDVEIGLAEEEQHFEADASSDTSNYLPVQKKSEAGEDDEIIQTTLAVYCSIGEIYWKAKESGSLFIWLDREYLKRQVDSILGPLLVDEAEQKKKLGVEIYCALREIQQAFKSAVIDEEGKWYEFVEKRLQAFEEEGLFGNFGSKFGESSSHDLPRDNEFSPILPNSPGSSQSSSSTDATTISCGSSQQVESEGSSTSDHVYTCSNGKRRNSDVDQQESNKRSRLCGEQKAKVVGSIELNEGEAQELGYGRDYHSNYCSSGMPFGSSFESDPETEKASLPPDRQVSSSRLQSPLTLLRDMRVKSPSPSPNPNPSTMMQDPRNLFRENNLSDVWHKFDHLRNFPSSSVSIQAPGDPFGGIFASSSSIIPATDEDNKYRPILSSFGNNLQDIDLFSGNNSQSMDQYFFEKSMTDATSNNIQEPSRSYFLNQITEVIELSDDDDDDCQIVFVRWNIED